MEVYSDYTKFILEKLLKPQFLSLPLLFKQQDIYLLCSWLAYPPELLSLIKLFLSSLKT